MSWVKVPFRDGARSPEQSEFARMLDASDMPYCENCLRAENEHWIMVLSSESDPDDFDRFCCWECAVSWTAAIVVLTTEDSDPSSQWEREA